MKSLTLAVLSLALCATACRHESPRYEPAPKPAAPVPASTPKPTPPAPVTPDRSQDTDYNITQQVKLALRNDAALSEDSKSVSVLVNHTVVTLTGSVPSETEKTRVGSIAQGVAGVVSVENQLTVKEN